MAAQFSRQLCGRYIEGVWHTGIVVFGKEYYYGGGVSYDEPGFTPFGPPTKTLELGLTEITEELFMEFLREISPRFTSDTYNVLKHNCNNFSDECAQFLLGSGIPKDIVDLPNIFLNTPLGKMVGPMLTQMQDNLKVNSHQLFNQNTGQQNPIVHHPGAGGQANSGAMNNQNMNDLNGFINQFASGMGGFGGGALSGIPQQMQQPSFGQQQAANSNHGGVIQIQNLQQLQNLIKESPALAVDFWSPTCPPCMRIKPVFESLCQSNDNDNLKFAAVNTQTCRDCAQAFNITSIPQFYFYVNGKEHSQFKGARQDQLVSNLAEISELVKSKASQHKNLAYKQFKPMNLAPQGFTSMANIEKMREFVQNFINSEDVKKEGIITENLTKWLVGFKIENMPREAVDELMQLIDIAEDKSKIALIDLIRLLMLQEHSAAHILNKHFGSFEVSIFGYLQCMDVKDPEAKIIQNYHLICLKMLGNIYQTGSGRDYMQGEEASSALLNFCTFSIDSVNPKVVFTAAVLMFNHLLCWKRDKALLQKDLETALTKIITVLQDQNLVDVEAILGLLLCECRIFYQNKYMCEVVTSKLEEQFKKSHQVLEMRVKEPKVRQSIDDIFMMLFE